MCVYLCRPSGQTSTTLSACYFGFPVESPSLSLLGKKIEYVKERKREREKEGGSYNLFPPEQIRIRNEIVKKENTNRIKHTIEKGKEGKQQHNQLKPYFSFSFCLSLFTMGFMFLVS